MTLKKSLIFGLVLAGGLVVQACAKKAAANPYLNGNLSSTSLTAYNNDFGSVKNSSLDSSSNPLNASLISAYNIVNGSNLMEVTIQTPQNLTDVMLLPMTTTLASSPVDANGSNIFSAWGQCVDAACNTYVMLLQENNTGANPAPQLAITLQRTSAGDGMGDFTYILTESSSNQARPN